MKAEMYNERLSYKSYSVIKKDPVYEGGAVVTFITTGFPKVIDGSKQTFYFSVLSYV